MVRSVRHSGALRRPEDHLDTALRTGPFDAALRAAIRRRGLPLDRLRFRLAARGIHVGLSSLSDWQHGHSRPERANSLRAVEALEDILGLPSASLLALLPPPGPAGAAGRPSRARPVQGVDEYSGPLGELLDSLPGSREWNLDLLHLEQRAFVTAARMIDRLRVRSLVRARRDGVDRYVTRYFCSPDGDVDRVLIRPVRNCRLGRVRRHPGGHVLVAEVLFGQALRTGDTWVFEDETIDPGSRARTEIAHGFRQPAEQVLLEVVFDPRARPARCYAYARADLYAERHRLEYLPVSGDHTAHLAMSGLTAGVRGIAWEWD
jgi:hypothetical protein